jgi:hypothetical protein
VLSCWDVWGRVSAACCVCFLLKHKLGNIFLEILDINFLPDSFKKRVYCTRMIRQRREGGVHKSGAVCHFGVPAPPHPELDYSGSISYQISLTIIKASGVCKTQKISEIRR